MEDKGIRSRKFIITMGVILVGTGLLIGGVIKPEHWVDVIKYISIAYLTAKIGEIGMKGIITNKTNGEVKRHETSNGL